MGNGAVKLRTDMHGDVPMGSLNEDDINDDAVTSVITLPKCAREQKMDGSDDMRPIPIGEGEEKVKGSYRSEPVSLDEVLGPADSVKARYRKNKAIGKGAFGEAYIVERNPLYPIPSPKKAAGGKGDSEIKKRAGDDATRLFVAKVMDLTSMSPNDRRYAQTEIMCLACNHHFAIIQYYEHFFIDDEDETIIIITEFADGGDLYRTLHNESSEFCLSETEAGIYFVQLLLGLDHVHRRRMIHRDVKTANIFLTTRGFLKLGDFGFSQQYDSTVSNPIACTFLGTSYYLAPEMWREQRYGKKADIWAAGIVLCELLGKRRPFEADSIPKMKELVLSGAMWLPPVLPENAGVSEEERQAQKKMGYISREMREFLEFILQQDPEKRPSASQLLKTPLMQHYLCLLKKRVDRMIALDDEMESNYKANPAGFAGSLPEYNISLEVRALVMSGIAEGEAVINFETEREMATSTTPRIESIVYKETAGSQWKERYLILADGFLTMTLAKGKMAAGSGERSKKVPLQAIRAVAPVVLDVPVLAESSGESGPFHVKFAFAISTQNAHSIVFATRTEQERDQWLSTMIVALKMD
ncbi:protein kinase, putative [Trypanosoma cruzi]|uniref:non-specific serine/threonine protein kinase n=1 Tax=Trypanosoma cruzi (strain CL Brener) TaxID=353153 RepID=Q4D4J4_TRYCC|nr:protein kinase, putative [Trypanosoma cruzi]EAN87441.1 protein kinase, putative [Trypanosoma cruzi]|eukprot:XP_809292.1 protein kinase [Trypanosoma cruzi strain CL Brener]